MNNEAKNKRLILVVEDEEVNREILGNILSKKYKVEFACDGEEGLSLIRRDRNILSCVLLDLFMPKRSGFEVLTEIRKDDMLRHIPVMILTAHQEAELQSLEYGAYDFITKPFDMPEIILARVSKTIMLAEETYIIRETEKDNLTDLPNLLYFQKLCQIEKLNLEKRQQKATYVYFDVISMKAYNSRYGFAEGDKLLFRIANLLQTVFEDLPVCRISDDHFAVMGGENELSRLVPDFMSKVRTTGRGKAVDLHAGIYTEEDEIDPISAMDYARLACNFIKTDFSKEICVFDNSLLKEFDTRQHVLENFEKALSEKWIKVFYQPIVRAITGEVCNFEALARWEDPERGMLNPGMFIPIIEDYKLSARMDLYMVEEVCREAKERIEGGIRQVPVSVNFSRNDFDMCDIVSEITKITDKYNVPHNMIVIEVTESAFSNNREYLQFQIDRFHSAGFKVWMDDFGDGFASLNVLQHHNFDLIKLDIGFMRNFDPNGKNGQILTDIIKMAQHLGIHTLSEGIESREQLEFLQEIGCEKIQGFYYGKPRPTKTSIENIKNGTALPVETPDKADFFENHWGFSFTKDMLNEIPGSILVYRATENEDILFANKEVIRLFECDSLKDFLEYTKHSFKNFVHPDDYEETNWAIWDQVNSSSSKRDYVRYRIITKKGNIINVEDLGHLVHHKRYGLIFFVFLYDERLKQVAPPQSKSKD